VITFLVARYGEFVLLRPQFAWHTAALWGLPPAALLIGIVVIVFVVRRRAPAAETANLSAAEEARLTELLRDG
jgi:cytochrome c-type biogenesis protein CcmH